MQSPQIPHENRTALLRASYRGQCRGVLLIWSRIGQGPTVLAVGAGGGCLDIFSLVYHFSFQSFLSPSLWETARYRLKYCLKGPLNPKQPTNQFVQRLRGQSALTVRGPYNHPTILFALITIKKLAISARSARKDQRAAYARASYDMSRD